jgi:hypothetical protein
LLAIGKKLLFLSDDQQPISSNLLPILVVCCDTMSVVAQERILHERILLIADGDRHVAVALQHAVPSAQITSVASVFDGVAELAEGSFTTIVAAAAARFVNWRATAGCCYSDTRRSNRLRARCSTSAWMITSSRL